MIIFQASIGLEAEASLVVKMFLYLMAISFQNIMYCYNGEKLITQSNLLPTAWYSCCWYNESAELKFLIRMMILRTNRALYMKMSGFSTMSLMTMLTVSKQRYYIKSPNPHLRKANVIYFFSYGLIHYKLAPQNYECDTSSAHKKYLFPTKVSISYKNPLDLLVFIGQRSTDSEMYLNFNDKSQTLSPLC
ncbi:hypothetical protein GQX74_004167 [Glossina fuscipes]|nr:hypothetical protein GQX74_004167 [Glossina fuscipes]